MTEYQKREIRRGREGAARIARKRREGVGKDHFHNGGDLQGLWDDFGHHPYYCDYETGYLKAKGI